MFDRIIQYGVDVQKVMQNGVVLWEKSGLPAGYTRVKYITKVDSNTSVIKTDYIFKPSHNVVMRVTAQAPQIITGNACCFAGNNYTDNSAVYVACWQSNSIWKTLLAPGAYTRRIEIDHPFTDGSIFTIEMSALQSDTYGIVNGGLKQRPSAIVGDLTNLYGDWSMYVYGANPSKNVSNFKLYDLSVYDADDDKTWEFIPCVNANNEIGLYSTGSASFIPVPNQTNFTYEL